ncbi:MAG TPA: FISUMP domain-containing protein, partial [Ignavibacteriaceae bacterium]|nr:FISUMP domain-containing protein [Ignavibacteriaceae bacterium]
IPTLFSPSDGASSVSFPVSLSWNPFSGAVSYTLEVSVDSAFSSFVFNQSNITTTTQQINGLSDSTTYFWRVSADNSSGPSDRWSFKTASSGGSAPAAPILLSPTSGAIDQPLSLALSWNLSSGATTYNLQLSDTSTFTKLLYDTSGITGTSHNVSGLSYQTSHYWRVSGTNKNGSSNWSGEWMFRTINAPAGITTLSSPGNGATNVSLPVTFVWNPTGGATSYTLQVSESSAFAAYVYNQSGLTGTSRQVTGLSDTTTYYWRVSADNSQGPSNTWSFKTASTGGTVPLAPVLLSPANNSNNQPVTLTLTWNPSSGASGYNLQVSTGNSFSTIIYNQSNINGTSHQISGLNNNTKYYWRVSGTNNNGSSNWSSIWNFTTAGLPPATPTLVFPVDLTIDVPFPVTFSWNASSGAQNYTLQISTSSTFSNILYNESGITGKTKKVTVLNPMTTYFWRVIASNTFGASNPSNIWSFTTNDGKPGVPTLLSPSDGSIDVDVTTPVTLNWNASFGATSYTLQVSESNLFTSYVFNQSVLTNTSQQVSGLSDSTKYYWRVNGTNNYGTSAFSSTWSFSTVAKFCPGLPTVTYSGKTYNTVRVGTQCWLKENLNVGVYVASTSTGLPHSNVSNNGIIEKYCYGNNVSNCDTFGGLYDWNEAMGYVSTPGTAGICPPGWHIPTYAEIEALIAAVNNDGNALKSLGQGSGSGAGTNTSGFSALLAGYRFDYGYFIHIGASANFWSSMELVNNRAYGLHLYSASSIAQFHVGKEDGLSVRCVKD